MQTKLQNSKTESNAKIILWPVMVAAMLISLTGCDNSNNNRQQGSYLGAADDSTVDSAALQVRMKKQFDR